MEFQQVFYKKIKLDIVALRVLGFKDEEVRGMVEWMGHNADSIEPIDLYIKAEISERKRIKYIAIGKPTEPKGGLNAGTEVRESKLQ